MLADARGVDGACGGRRPTDPRGAGSFCRAQLAVGYELDSIMLLPADIVTDIPPYVQ